MLYEVITDPETDPLFPLKSDEVEVKEEKEEEEPGDEKEGEPAGSDGSKMEIHVAAEGWAARTMAVPGLAAGNYAGLAAVV